MASDITLLLSDLQTDIIRYMGRLESAALGYSMEDARTRVLAVTNPAITIDSPSGTSEDIAALQSTMSSAIDVAISNLASKINTVDSWEKPPTLTSLGDNPFTGWNGVDGSVIGFDVNDIINELSFTKWSGPNAARTVALARYLLGDTKVYTTNTLSNALGRSGQSEVGLLLGYRHDDLISYINLFTETYIRDSIKAGIDMGLTMDKLLSSFQAQYGQIYAALIDVLVDKAGKEADWFSKDYKTRLELWSSANEVNADIFIKSIDQAINNILVEADMATKAALEDFDNYSKSLMVTYKFDVLDKAYELNLSKGDNAKFEIDLKAAYTQGKIYLENYTAGKINEIGLLSAVVAGYSNLVGSAQSSYIELVSPTVKPVA